VNETQTNALIDLARGVADLIQNFAEVWEASAPNDDPARSTPNAADALGQRQREILNALRKAQVALTGTEISGRMNGYDLPNLLGALRALQQKTPPLVEELPGEQPRKWRLTPFGFELTFGEDPYLIAASVVQPGEWTTYGELSKAVRHDDTAARSIGQKAAKNPKFPAPHRVLSKGGKISPHWQSHKSPRPNPDLCRQLLEAEGIKFNYLGQALERRKGDDGPEQQAFVDADTIRARMTTT
jgi:O6-methylguanine-DNA--protein-cysteine methyltransferase